MSRSGYSDDCENLGLYRGAVDRALQGQRGQAFLRELAAAMDAMPEKVLITGDLINEQGQCCTIGVVCKTRGLDVTRVAASEPDDVAKMIGLARSMTAEIAFMNDEWESPRETPAARWVRMRKWVSDNLGKP